MGHQGPPSLGPEKADGAWSSHGEGPLPALHRPVALRPKLQTLLLPTRGPRLCQARECPCTLLRVCYCHRPSPKGPPALCALHSLHRGGATFR